MNTIDYTSLDDKALLELHQQSLEDYRQVEDDYKECRYTNFNNHKLIYQLEAELIQLQEETLSIKQQNERKLLLKENQDKLSMALKKTQKNEKIQMLRVKQEGDLVFLQVRTKSRDSLVIGVEYTGGRHKMVKAVYDTH